MPLPPPSSSRREAHLRRIEMRGYERDDGLYDVEARLTDTKSDGLRPPAGERTVAPGEPIHDLWLRLTVDTELVVHDVVSASDATPYTICGEGGANLRRMVGVRIASGWSVEVKRRLGGAAACTHLMELLIPMGTAAFQTLAPVRLARPDRLDAAGRPVKIDSCTAYAADRGVVARRWPAHYVGTQSDASIGADLDPEAVRAAGGAGSPPAPCGVPGRR